MSSEVDALRREVAELRGAVESMRAEVDALRREAASAGTLARAALELAKESARAGLEHRRESDEAIDRFGEAVVALARSEQRRTADCFVLARQMNALAGAAEPDDEPWRESLRPDGDDD